ncbi:MAG: serine hydrolase [Gammaproteobacteria bacterium]|nr:serine hydrolase [Gammaproteobacteria bacterium]
MKRAAATTFLILTFAASARELPIVRPDRVDMSAERLARITQLNQTYVDQDKLAGVLTMVARDGKIVHVSVVGTRGATDETPLTEDALFRIYSMSKPITAVAAMILYEEGKFQLRDPVSRYIPELANLDVMIGGERVPAKNTMTMQHLLTHTAGFTYGFDPDDPVDRLFRETDPLHARDLDEFIQRLASLPLKFEPGTHWHYSVAVDVTGAVVERISGQRFDVFLKNRLFDPLNMHDTFFNVPEQKMGRLLPNHRWDRDDAKLVTLDEAAQTKTSATDYFVTGYKNTLMFSGGGGLVSTARDYMRFAEMLRNGGELDGVRILSPKTIEFMVTDHLPASVSANAAGETPALDLAGRNRGFGFGLGFGVVTDVNSLGIIGSLGEYSWGGEAGTIFWVDPVEEIVTVSLIQLMGSPWALRSELKVLTNQAITELK